MDNKTLWILLGVGAVVLVLVMRRGASSQVIPGADTTAETTARFQFAEQGLASVSKLASDLAGFQAQQEIAAQQSQALEYSADAYASAQRANAAASEAGKHGIHLHIPVIGDIGFNW